MIELHIFTNCTDIIGHKKTIADTYSSWCERFGCQVVPTIWVDANPNRSAYGEYERYLKTTFPASTINRVRSLSDGYIQMIDTTSSEFVFVLEHDWTFLLDVDLSDAIQIMKDNHISHMRFNKFDNDESVGVEGYRDYLASSFHDEYCEVKSASNNPHIVWVPTYKQTARKYIRFEKGSLGVEQNLRSIDDCSFAIYGGKNMKATVAHTDGRDSWDGWYER